MCVYMYVYECVCVCVWGGVKVDTRTGGSRPLTEDGHEGLQGELEVTSHGLLTQA